MRRALVLGAILGAFTGVISTIHGCDAGCEVPDPPADGRFVVVDASDPALLGYEFQISGGRFTLPFEVDGAVVEVEYRY